MRMLTLPLPLLMLITASAAFVQNAQTAVDIGVSTPRYSNGMVEARVTRKDPTADKSAPAPVITVRVTIAVRGEKPFFSKDVAMKPGSAETVAAPYKGDGSATSFTASAFAVEMKEIAAADNTRSSAAAVVGTMTLPGRLPIPGTGQVIPPRDPASKPNPNPPPAQPAPAPAPASIPHAETITTPSLVLIGGAAGSPAVSAATGGATVTTSSLVLIGGTQGNPPTASAGASITTTPLVLIGRRE